MRVAKVKYNNKDKLYSYICDLKDVYEGDVVLASGASEPLIVYEIADEALNPNIKYNKIIKKLAINNDVTVTTKYMDITNSKCDCIVNSLGVNTSVYGNICEAIVDAAQSKEIEKMLKEHPKADVFDIFVTDAGKLSCKKIIHIVMPFKAEDKFNKNLKIAFSKVIEKAIELGMKSIAIPCIGTGANGYNKNDIYEAIDNIMFKYIYTPNIKIDIESIMYNKTRAIRNHIKDEMLYMMTEIGSNTKIGSSIKIADMNLKKMQANIRFIYEKISLKYNVEDELKISVSDPYYYQSAYSFVDTAIDNSLMIKSKVTVDLKKYYHRFNDISDFRTGRKELSKADVFRISVAMKLNFTQFIQFMTLAGYTFSPLITKKNYCGDLIVFVYAVKNDGFKLGLNDFIEYVNLNASQEIVNILCPVSDKVLV